jgi:carbon-monoxide dehydrogenase large subunit
MTDGRKRAFGVEGADVGLGLRPKNIGARVKRVEDPRLLTGQGSFTADRIVPGALHVAFRRSDHAHALIASISTSLLSFLALAAGVAVDFLFAADLNAAVR